MIRILLGTAFAILAFPVSGTPFGFSIDGRIDGITSGHVYVIEMTSRDTIGQSPIENHYFLIQESWPTTKHQVITAMLVAVQSDHLKSIACPVAVEQANISLLINEHNVPQYSGTPLQDKFSRFVLEASDLDARLFDKASGNIVDSVQNALTHRTEQFYLQNKGTALDPFLSLMIADIISRKLLDPSDFSVIPNMCETQDAITDYEQEICKAIELYKASWEGVQPLKISERDYAGKEFRLADRLGEGIMIIDFWASWCGPCMKEMPTIKSLVQQYEIEVIGISIDRNQDAWKAAVQKLELPWTNIRDTTGEIAKAYNVTSIPAKFVINKAGLIVARNPDDLEAAIMELIGK